MSNKIRCILVEDSETFRNLVKSVLESNPQIEVVSQATNGKLALPRIKHYQPDVLILDLEMPEMNGLDLLREIKGKYPDMYVIMLSAHTIEGARLTIQCLEEGAWDFVTKPNLQKDGDPVLYLENKLIPRILELNKIKNKNKQENQKLPLTTLKIEKEKINIKTARHVLPGSMEVCGIGISTGGPVALRELFQKLQTPLKGTILIVQHMPPIFTKQLAESLNGITPITVLEAQDGMPILPNHAYVAPGGWHMGVHRINEKGYIKLSSDPPEENCRPSVNFLFRSLARFYGNKAVGIIMTGMGSDGYLGILELRKTNGYIIAQSPESCLIFGMPERPIQEKLVDEVGDIAFIAEKIQYLLGT